MATLAELARRLKRTGGAAMAQLPPLILMTDSRRLADPERAVPRLPAGAAVILRHRDPVRRATLAALLIGPCRARGVRLLIAGDARLAAAVGADGLHLPEAMARRGPGAWSMWQRPDWLITAAAHGPAALCRAARAGAHGALLSPVFPTASHPGAAALGPLRFARLVRESPLPVYALGGIDNATARRLILSGAAGFAGIGGLLRTGSR